MVPKTAKNSVLIGLNLMHDLYYGLMVEMVTCIGVFVYIIIWKENANICTYQVVMYYGKLDRLLASYLPYVRLTFYVLTSVFCYVDLQW